MRNLLLCNIYYLEKLISQRNRLLEDISKLVYMHTHKVNNKHNHFNTPLNKSLPLRNRHSLHTLQIITTFSTYPIEWYTIITANPLLQNLLKELAPLIPVTTTRNVPTPPRLLISTLVPAYQELGEGFAKEVCHVFVYRSYKYCKLFYL